MHLQRTRCLLILVTSTLGACTVGTVGDGGEGPDQQGRFGNQGSSQQAIQPFAYLLSLRQTFGQAPLTAPRLQALAETMVNEASCRQVVRAQLAGSAAERRQALDDGAFVDALYGTLLQREADDPGRAHWVGQLGQGMSRAQVIDGFVGGAEQATICQRLVNGQADAAHYVQRRTLLRRACYCLNCRPNELAEAQTRGCRYIRWALFPWGANSFAEFVGPATPTHRGFFDQLEANTTAYPGMVLEFGIPEWLSPLHSGAQMALDSRVLAEINATTGWLYGNNDVITSAAPFSVDGDLTRGNHHSPRLDTLKGWAWHYAMAVQAMDAGARAIYISQVNLRQDNPKVSEHLLKLLQAIQNYAKRTLGSRVVIGAESIADIPVGNLGGQIHFIKSAIDTDVAQGNPGDYHALDHSGNKVACLGQQQLQNERANISFQSWGTGLLRKGQLCVLASNRQYNTHHHPHAHPFENLHGIESVLWELDGCHDCSFTMAYRAQVTANGNGTYNHPTGIAPPVAPTDSPYVVWAKAPNDDTVTRCHGAVRSGLATTMHFISQPSSVRRAFIRLVAAMTRALSGGATNHVFPSPFKLDQNHFWQVDASTNPIQRDELRQCPSDTGVGNTDMHHAGPLYWASVCGDADAISAALAGEPTVTVAPKPNGTPTKPTQPEPPKPPGQDAGVPNPGGQDAGAPNPGGQDSGAPNPGGQDSGAPNPGGQDAGLPPPSQSKEEQLVRAAFTLVLTRPVDAGALSFYVGQLQSGQKKGLDVLLDLAYSQEFETLHSQRTNRAFVAYLVQRLLERSTSQDPAGWSFFTAQLDGGKARADVTADFLNSSEFRNLASHAIYF